MAEAEFLVINWSLKVMLNLVAPPPSEVDIMEILDMIDAVIRVIVGDFMI